MIRTVGMAIATCLLLAASSPAMAQRSLADVLGRPAAAAGQPRTFLEEVMLFGYVENSVVGNLRGTGRDDVNELRIYDLDGGYTFNTAELGVRKDPSDAHPFGFGLFLTAGEDARKNHALGMFRGDGDVYPYRDTVPLDLLEAHVSYRLPLGSGLTVKAGKFASLLGYEFIEAPLNLNFSRSLLFGFAVPFTHVGALLSYAFDGGLTLTAGPVVGWDVARDNNGGMSLIGQLAFAPTKDWITAFSWITGPEQPGDSRHPRTVLDGTLTYTGLRNTVLGANVDYGWERREPSLVGAGRSSTTATWWGVAGYAAHDWTETLRTSLRAEYFVDADSVRTAARAPGLRTAVWETTATLRYTIWNGLIARLEYRHDQANARVFKITGAGPTSRAQNTLTLAVHYLFF